LIQATSRRAIVVIGGLFAPRVQLYLVSDGGGHLPHAHVVVLDLLLGALDAVFGRGAEGEDGSLEVLRGQGDLRRILEGDVAAGWLQAYPVIPVLIL